MTSSEHQNNKRIAKNTLFLYFRSIVILLINLYISRAILETMGVEDYGIYNVVGGVVALFSVIAGTLSSATQRFITFALGENDLSKLKQTFSNSVCLHIILGLAGVLFLEVCGIWFLNNQLEIPLNRMNSAHWVLQFSIIAFFVNMVSIPYNALIVAHEKMKAFAYIGILECVLKLLAVLSLFICPFDKLIAYGLYILLIAVVVCLIYTFYCHKNFDEAKKINLSIQPGIFKEMFAFAGWNFLGNGSLVLRNQGIDILLNMFFGVTVNAAKGLSNQVQHAVSLLVTNFQTAVKPQLTKAIAQNDRDRYLFLINQGTRFSFFMMLFITVPIMIAAPDILKIWLKTVPAWTVAFVRWTLVYLLIDTMSRFLIHAILSNGKIRNYEILVGGTKLLALPIAYVFLINSMSPLIGIWVNIGLEVICLLERLFYCKKLLDFPVGIFVRKVCLTSIAILILSIVLPAVVKYHFTQNMFVLIIVSCISTTLCIALMGMNSNERCLIKDKIVQFIQKKMGSARV